MDIVIKFGVYLIYLFCIAGVPYLILWLQAKVVKKAFNTRAKILRFIFFLGWLYLSFYVFVIKEIAIPYLSLGLSIK